MPPSTGWAPMCCCSKNARKKQFEFDNRGDITIRINGKEELTVHNVPMPRPKSVQEVPRLAGVEVHQMTGSPSSSRSLHSNEDYVTARTSRDLQMKHKSMTDLMREVREEHGLPVTQREPPSPQEQPLSVNELLLLEREKRLRRAVFNEEGDISSRTFSPRDLNGNIEARKTSVMTITVEETLVLPVPARSSTVMKYVSAAPQMIFAMITLSYAWITGIVASLLR